MLCYVELEHAVVMQDPTRREAHLAARMEEKRRFEKLAGMPCLILDYSLAVQGWVERIRPVALLFSGNRTDWSAYDPTTLEKLERLICDWQRPLIGLCGGHQLVARAFGATIGPLRALEPDETDPKPDYGPGRLKEWGPTEIRRLRPDPLLEGLPERFCMEQEHYWDVKTLPPALQQLATTEDSPVQIFRHRERPVYGTQFHPERYSEGCPHGRQLLENFFHLIPRQPDDRDSA